MRFWRYDPLPRPNDGKCPFCGHQQGPTFGHFYCESCGKLVADNDLARNIQTMSRRAWLKSILGGILLGGVVVLLGLLAQRFMGG